MKSQKILLFRDAAETQNISVHFEKGTFWLTQKTMATLFGVERSVVTKHLKNIFETKELEENSVCAKFAHTAADGKNYNTQFYRLEAILSVGYRVNSTQATDFRRWATETLNEFIIKGFIIDDERLKQGKNLVLNFTAPSERHLCSLVNQTRRNQETHRVGILIRTS
jgi:hypothetical protein